MNLDNLSGMTKVFAASAGTKTGLFDLFDWGAGDDFEEEVRRGDRGMSLLNFHDGL